MAKRYILASISVELHKKHRSMETATEIMASLLQMFGQNTHFAREAALKRITDTKMEEGTKVQEFYHSRKLPGKGFSSRLKSKDKNDTLYGPIFCHPKAASWKPEEGNNIDCCSWDGVQCNENTGHVIKLDLSSSCLQGSINSSSSLFKLVHLEWLDLAFNDFDGSEIPPEIINLSSLSYLNLSSAAFSGQIPSEILELSKLGYLDLSHNSYYDPVELRKPSLGNLVDKLTNLKELVLGDVTISSPIPHNLTYLSSLTTLSLSGCDLRGRIPSSLGNITRLIHLDLSFNKLSDELPTFIGTLGSLKELDLLQNNLSGELPNSISNLASLEQVDLSLNRFLGKVPSSLGNLTQLHWLSLASNDFSGELPASFGNLRSLRTLDVYECKFSGQIPSSLSNLTHLSFLDFSLNNFSGKMDLDIFLVNHKLLYHLFLSTNRLSLLTKATSNTTSHRFRDVSLCSCDLTEIPKFLKNQHHLELLDLASNKINGKVPKWLLDPNLQHNKFSGTIPDNLLKGNILKVIDLSDNLLQGRIPRSLANCSNLEFLDLGDNQIRDIFPSWLGTLPDLNVLILKSNKFHGLIREPKTDCGFPKLRIIDLSKNRFTGKLPSMAFQCWNAMKVVNASELRYMQEVIPFNKGNGIYDYSLTMSNKGQMMSYKKIPNILTAVILSSNRFDGEIPTSISNLKGLQILSLADNSLHGHIPSCLGNLTDLESLDLSNNRFSGQIPQQLVELTFLEFFNVSDNHFTGPIPQGKQFATFDKTSFDGNSGLCGRPLSSECEISEAPTNEDQIEDSEESLLSGVSDWKIILIGYAGGLIVGVVLGLNFSTRILEWFMEKFGTQSKRRRSRRRGCRN
ncbi:receptor-like protein 9DC3 [Citrus sinensis]|uniref:receptor-like protein 9DC3 n=1 Tax=Citrus clementina TaxID=85681 RepID=UPI000CED45DE|nr:receptor-like protein 9DC3 [Citrus x clementina]XP_052298821.1 receptor-like protein 9DC3 [Citrus sinensis]